VEEAYKLRGVTPYALGAATVARWKRLIN